jgi:hypothetical protein
MSLEKVWSVRLVQHVRRERCRGIRGVTVAFRIKVAWSRFEY